MAVVLLCSSERDLAATVFDNPRRLTHLAALSASKLGAVCPGALETKELALDLGLCQDDVPAVFRQHLDYSKVSGDLDELFQCHSPCYNAGRSGRGHGNEADCQSRSFTKVLQRGTGETGGFDGDVGRSLAN